MTSFQAAQVIVWVLVAGCSLAKPYSPERSQVAGLSDRDALAVYSVLYWYREYREPERTYSVQENQYLSDVAKSRIAKSMSDFRESDSGSIDILSITDIVIQEPFAAVEMQEGNLGFLTRFGLIFRKDKDGWQYVDTVGVLAEHSFRALVSEIDWQDYLRDFAIDSESSAGRVD